MGDRRPSRQAHPQRLGYQCRFVGDLHHLLLILVFLVVLVHTLFEDSDGSRAPAIVNVNGTSHSKELVDEEALQKDLRLTALIVEDQWLFCV